MNKDKTTERVEKKKKPTEFISSDNLQKLKR